LLIAKGELAGAREMLWEVVTERPDLIRGWGLLSWVLGRLGDGDGLEKCIKRLMSSAGGEENYVLWLAKGHLCAVQNDLKGARLNFEKALTFAPENPYLLELILRLNVHELDAAKARQNVKRLLRADPDNSYGNYIMGSLQLYDGEYDLAEASYRRSLRQTRFPDAINDLAWLLQKQNRIEEAEALARECVSMAEANSRAWDTLAVILTKKGELAEAEKAFQNGIAHFQGNYTIYLHMAELYAQMNQPDRALELIGFLKSKHVVLPSDDENRLAALRRDLEAKLIAHGQADPKR